MKNMQIYIYRIIANEHILKIYVLARAHTHAFTNSFILLIHITGEKCRRHLYKHALAYTQKHPLLSFDMQKYAGMYTHTNGRIGLCRRSHPLGRSNHMKSKAQNNHTHT